MDPLGYISDWVQAPGCLSEGTQKDHETEQPKP